ncbi:E3 ubiquitin-protein ligase DCST1 [Cebus imitator]|uniref:E3 ubiquitin-protein ligase DCST1 n=1 Tax=Cebus imitator TaxID=2715852 RepID=UPI00189AD7AA|nr:E3 ubiquitin-protein ligase DCST1 [Cebus imitator]
MDIQHHENGARGQRRKQPHTTVQRLLSWGLPVSCSRFLWRQPGEFPVTAFLLGAGAGGLLAIGLFQLLVNPMNIYEEQKMMFLYSLVGLGAMGWGTSPHIRCASLLLVPKMLGKEGRLFVLGYALAAIYMGPVANLRHNLNDVIASLGCTVELQINNTRAAWRVSTAPLRAVFKDLLSSKELLRAETQNISTTFKDLDAQVNSETGYTPEEAVESGQTAQGREARQAPASRLHLSTQKMYELKTKLRCSYVVSQAILSCHRWFDRKHEQCMKHIWVPLLSHLLCLPMKFKFFCGIAKVMEVWCRNRIPVEGNFGQTYDSLNRSIHGLDGEFSANIDLKVGGKLGCWGTDNRLKSPAGRPGTGGGGTMASGQRRAGGSEALTAPPTGMGSPTQGCPASGLALTRPLACLPLACLPQPVGLDARAYWRAALPIVLLVWLSLLQAFGYRLRRVIAAFYFPKREKKRILFLYNELLKKRAAFTKLRRAAILRRARQQKAPRHPLADILHRQCPLLRRWLRRRCVVCQAPETPESYVCPTLDCQAVYCWSCWGDMRQRCPVCTPREELSSSAFSDSDDDTAYAR